MRALVDNENDIWLRTVAAEIAGSGPVDAHFVNLVTHAPMPARMRNELINRGYARMANDLAAILYPSGVPDNAAPNFFCFAHWASAYVGERIDTARGRFIKQHLEDGNAAVFHSMARAFLAFQQSVTTGVSIGEAAAAINRTIPPAARVNASVDALVNTQMTSVPSSLRNETSGLPSGLFRSVDPAGTGGAAAVLNAVRARGFEAYRRARNALCETDRRQAILEGNAWLVISEQAMVDPALSKAMRSLVRTAASPLAALTASRRSRAMRMADGSGQRESRLEDAWIELISRSLEWSAPPGVMAGAPPLWFRPNGPPSVARWARSAAADGLPSGSPFCWFEVPDLEVKPLFWTSLQDRLPVIFSVLAASHDGPWFERGRFREHESWAGFADAARAYLHATAPLAGARDPKDQRSEDWAIAHRLFARDRELIYAALFTRSLPASYASAHGAALLDLSAHNLNTCPSIAKGAMADDSLLRVRTSASFVDAMLSSPHAPGTLEDTASQGTRTKSEWLGRVAEVHRHVRRRVQAEVRRAGADVPDASLFDDPLGYEQLVGAGVSFVVPVVSALEQHFGRSWTAQERNCWARVWLEIALHQGLEEVLVRPCVDDYLGWKQRPVDHFTYADMVVAEQEVRRRNDVRSLSGMRLADKLRRDLEDAVPGACRSLIGLGFSVFGDQEINRLLLIPGTRFDSSVRASCRRLPAVVRWSCRWFIRLVLREIETATEQPAWDEVFAPVAERRCSTIRQAPVQWPRWRSKPVTAPANRRSAVR